MSNALRKLLFDPGGALGLKLTRSEQLAPAPCSPFRLINHPCDRISAEAVTTYIPGWVWHCGGVRGLGPRIAMSKETKLALNYHEPGKAGFFG